MYYIKIKDDNENQLTYYCRNCGYVDETLAEEGTCVLNTNLDEESVQSYDHIINKYTKLDPTLPRLYNLKCPNSDCVTNKSKGENNVSDNLPLQDTANWDSSKRSVEESLNTEVIYIRYNEKDMKYLYLCTTCDFVWKTNEN